MAEGVQVLQYVRKLRVNVLDSRGFLCLKLSVDLVLEVWGD